MNAQQNANLRSRSRYGTGLESNSIDRDLLSLNFAVKTLKISISHFQLEKLNEWEFTEISISNDLRSKPLENVNDWFFFPRILLAHKNCKNLKWKVRYFNWFIFTGFSTFAAFSTFSKSLNINKHALITSHTCTYSHSASDNKQTEK